jgi:hypothetical protein
MDKSNLSVGEALAELEQIAPGAPFLALGQTVFWDEPMKSGIALASRRLGYNRSFVAGVHDTDYFAKLPSGRRQPGKFQAFPHNDTTTKGIWSAAGEFSTLFGSETVVTREALHRAGAKIERVRRSRPEILDEITEAWGWRGVVSLDEAPPVSAELPIGPVFHEIRKTLDWALDLALDSLTGESRQQGEEYAQSLREKLCDALEADSKGSLSSFYRRLLPDFYDFVAGSKVGVDTTTTTELLQFNSKTAGLPRFQLLNAFLAPETAEIAKAAYDTAIHGSGLYEISRFGSGAIPFDLVVPGKGRGTIRIGRRGIVIMTRDPLFISLKKPIGSVSDLARAIEDKFGTNCTLVGKAVTLIGMLASEFVFIFHEGASSYVKYSRTMHRSLSDAGVKLKLNPILRVRYQTWDSLQVACSWMHLPEPFQRPFGTEEVCAPSFAARWKQVGNEQEELLSRLGELKRPIDLIRFLEGQVGGSWSCLAAEYEDLHRQLEDLRRKLESGMQERKEIYQQIKALKARRVHLELQKGEHFREHIFEKDPTPADLQERADFESEIDAAIQTLEEAKTRRKSILKEQREWVQDPAILKVHERRRSIELEAELKRIRIIREATISSAGLRNADVRPSAWWFPLVSPDGLWFRQTVESALCHLEPLV